MDAQYSIDISINKRIGPDLSYIPTIVLSIPSISLHWFWMLQTCELVRPLSTDYSLYLVFNISFFIAYIILNWNRLASGEIDNWSSLTKEDSSNKPLMQPTGSKE
jgi:hypothetical protein